MNDSWQSITTKKNITKLTKHVNCSTQFPDDIEESKIQIYIKHLECVIIIWH